METATGTEAGNNYLLMLVRLIMEIMPLQLNYVNSPGTATGTEEAGNTIYSTYVNVGLIALGTAGSNEAGDAGNNDPGIACFDAAFACPRNPCALGCAAWAAYAVGSNDAGTGYSAADGIALGTFAGN